MTLHLYCVVRAGVEPPPMAGVGHPPSTLSTVAYREVAAVLSELPEGALTEDDAATHLDVLSALVVAGPVLPLRFGTVAPDVDAVREEVLAASYDELLALLDELDGQAELRVEFAFDEESVLRGIVASDEEIRTLSAETGGELTAQIRLGELAVDRVASSCRTRGQQLIDALAPPAEDVRRLDSTEPHVDRWALLVRADRVSELDEKVAGLRAAAPDTQITYLGPFPAFTFLDEAAARASTPASRWGW